MARAAHLRGAGEGDVFKIFDKETGAASNANVIEAGTVAVFALDVVQKMGAFGEDRLVRRQLAVVTRETGLGADFYVASQASVDAKTQQGTEGEEPAEPDGKGRTKGP